MLTQRHCRSYPIPGRCVSIVERQVYHENHFIYRVGVDLGPTASSGNDHGQGDPVVGQGDANET